MDKKVLAKLEFDKIISMLAGKCTSQLGKELAADLEPSGEIEQIRSWQAETTEAKEILRLFPSFSLGGIRDLRVPLRKADMGGIMDPQEFLNVYDTLAAARRIKSFLAEHRDRYPLLALYGETLALLPKLEQVIKKAITPDAEVSDDASEELARIRKQLRNLIGKAKEKLENMVRSPEIQKYLQDPIITIRSDRYCIPVKQEYRSQIQGIIHDQSASGATLFIEPLAVVEINNETQRYELLEKAEVARILRTLTQLVQAEHDPLKVTCDTLGMLDFIFAKGKLSTDLDCGEPKLNTRSVLKIVQGRHPLLKGRAVPSTVHLGFDFDTLVITGPNTGGKTVTLKTVGLLVLMTQAGLHVPAQTGTEIGVFTKVFADIGDEQSIEQSLSTFSSHMTNIIDILDKVDDKSLVLLDELGAGTDPTEGAALAMAVLEHLINCGAKTIATTHYSELKSFAYNRDRVENASVEFDVISLQPTYRLLIGVPGKSNAFEISRRLGLSEEIVQRAKGFLSQEEIRVADLIENLETNQLLSEKDRQEAERLKKLAQAKLKEIDKRDRELEDRASALLKKAQREALEIVNQARRESEELLKAMKEQAKRAGQEGLQDLRKYRDKLKETEEQLQEEVYKAPEGEDVNYADLEPGDLVIIKRLNQKAQVLEKPRSPEEIVVQAGIMKLSLKAQDLQKFRREDSGQEPQKSGTGKIVAAKAKSVKNELDLRGLTVDEAIEETEKYLDDAYLAGLPQAYLIHGKGTGALRSAINDLVKKHRFIKSARIGGYHEGGLGVTVVEFK